MVQVELKARTTDPETSQEALTHISKKQQKIIDELGIRGERGGTSGSLAARFAIGRDSVSPIMPKLEAAGLVTRTGYKRNILPHGTKKSWQTVWAIKGLEFKPYPNDRKIPESQKGVSMRSILIETQRFLEKSKEAIDLEELERLLGKINKITKAS